jgi:secondary thiamine-phosphate synthase enzyme
MNYEYKLSTSKEHLYDITSYVQRGVNDSGVKEGLAVVYCPHTTAGITVNENGDPDVVTDIIFGLRKVYPAHKEFRHFEGNSDAHLKSTAVGCDQTIIIRGGKLLLGTWQSIYFCEFDPPRNRTFYVKIVEA